MADPLHQAPPLDDLPVMTVYPSICATGLGRVLGVLYESLPFGPGTLKLSHLLFTLPSVPLVLPLYVYMKVLGPRYRLTTRHLHSLRTLSFKPTAQMPLDEVGRVEIERSLGTRFYKAGDLVVRDHLGGERLRLRGVVRPEAFRSTLLEARDALVRTEAARRTIAGRRV